MIINVGGGCMVMVTINQIEIKLVIFHVSSIDNTWNLLQFTRVHSKCSNIKLSPTEPSPSAKRVTTRIHCIQSADRFLGKFHTKLGGNVMTFLRKYCGWDHITGFWPGPTPIILNESHP